MAFKIFSFGVSTESNFFLLGPSNLKFSVAKAQVRSKYFSHKLIDTFNSLLGKNAAQLSSKYQLVRRMAWWLLASFACLALLC